ncbi:MAG: TolB family protein, partial [Chloroflexota bacterium]
YGISFSWSPNGDRIAYTAIERGQPSRLWVVAVDGADEPVALTPVGADMQLDGEQAPRWSADGGSIACQAVKGHWAVAADGSGARQV